MKQNQIENISTALSGGVFGGILYFTSLHLNDGVVTTASVNPVALAVCILIFSVAASLVRVGIALASLYIFKSDIDKELKESAVILSVPVFVLLLVPVVIRFYARLSQASLPVLGYIYLPFTGYTHVNMAGYAFFLLTGFMWLAPVFLFAVKFIKNFYDNDLFFHAGEKTRVVFIASFVFFALATPYVTLIYPPTGDEPHYLLIGKNIMEGQGMDLENAYVTQKSYKDFYPVDLEYKNLHNTADKDGKGIYSLHSPGVPVYVMLFNKYGGRFLAGLAMNFLAAALICLFYIFLREFICTSAYAGLVSLLLAVTSPIAVNSSLILTEIPSALAVLYCVYFLMAWKKDKKAWLFFAAISIMPWLHSKMLIYPAIFYAVYYFIIFRNRAFNAGKETFYNILPFASAAFFLFFYYHYYGKLAPFALVSIYTTSSSYFAFSLKHSLKACVAVLFDRDYGLLTYNLLFVPALTGLALAATRKEWKKLAPFAAAVPYLAVFLNWNDWTGSMTPARQLIPVLPLLAVYAAYFIKETGFVSKKLFAFFSGYSVLVSFMLFWMPFLRYAASKDKIYAAAGKAGRAFLWILPTFRDKINAGNLITAVYAGLIVYMYYKYSGASAGKKG